MAYVRVSSPNENLARQLDAVRAAEPDKVYDEKQSGASREGRTALAEMSGYVREGASPRFGVEDIAVALGVQEPSSPRIGLAQR